jgi:hypothetical protein
MERATLLMMAPYLLTARAAIICWVTLSLIPFEAVYDAIEDALEQCDMDGVKAFA